MNPQLELNNACFGVKVAISRSGEKGEVTGFSQHMRTQAQFYVEYTNGTGCSREGWFFADQLTVI